MNRLRSGRTRIEKSNAPTALSETAFPVQLIVITATETNTGAVTIGDSSCSAVTGDRRGFCMNPGQIVQFENVDLSEIFVNAVVAGDSVYWGAQYGT
jgi:hypothetical protein